MFVDLNTSNKIADTVKPRMLTGMRRLQKEEEGSILILTLFLLLTVLLITGMAVDLIRTETSRSRLQATLDRAVLAGASLTQTLDSKAVIMDYFTKAGMAGSIDINNINVVSSGTGKSVTASAELEINSFFLNMIGIDSLKAPAKGTAEESVTDIEISLVVDTSGSMGRSSSSGQTKLYDLKQAAKEFVYLMQCDPGANMPFDGNCTVDPDTVSISLVPYNEQVLLGENLIQQFNTTEEHASSSCIDFDASDYTQVAVELDPQVADPLALADLTPNLRRSATIAPWGTDTVARDWRRTCNPNTDRTVSAYENRYQDLYTAIDQLYASGYTSIELGMKWGAALLDPTFRPAVTNMSQNLGLISPNFVGRPFDYGRGNTKKVVVLMTDGKNTTQHLVRDGFRTGPSPFYESTTTDAHANHVSVYDPVQGDYYWVEHDVHMPTPEGGAQVVQLSYPEFWDKYSWELYRIVDGPAHLPAAVDRVFNAEKDVRLDAMCDAAKAQGIIIYTMGFETSAASSSVMQACATSPSHFYDVNGTDIGVAFNSIARNINVLRLVN